MTAAERPPRQISSAWLGPESNPVGRVWKKWELEKIGEICNIQIDSNKYDNIMDMLLLYKLLKNERNNFNHMSDSSLRADQNTLGQAIRMFIECGRKVYE